MKNWIKYTLTDENGKKTIVKFDDLEFQRLHDCFECRGEDKERNLYSGLITKSCGEYGEITDVVLIKRAIDRASLGFDVS